MADRESERGDLLAHALSSFLGFSGEGLRMMAEDADPADRRMLVRRVIEYETAVELASRAGPGGPGPGTVTMPGPEHCEDAGSREFYACSQEELRETEARWLHRYDSRPATDREYGWLDRTFDGRTRPDQPPYRVTGIDGTRSLAVTLVRRDGGRDGAVLSLTDAGFLETVSGFPGPYDRQAWLDGREYGRVPGADGLPRTPVPLAAPGSLAGPEERVLAWLLREPGAARGAATLLQARSFSAYSRAETFLAWRSVAERNPVPPLAEVRYELARRLLRAPDWAAGSVGWPFGHIGLAYFDRLAVTPVTPGQATAALDTVTREAAAPGRPVPPPPAQVDRRCLLGRAAARGLVIPGPGDRDAPGSR